MKNIIYKLTKDYELYIFAIFGLLLIVIPQYLVKWVPYVMGVGLILYGCFNLFNIFRITDKTAHPGKQLVYLVVGLVTLLQGHESLVTLGVFWALLILLECGEEIDELYHTGEFHPIPMIWMVISLVLAVMLMHDPMEHFVFHMRILGLETIAFSAIHWWRRRQAQ